MAFSTNFSDCIIAIWRIELPVESATNLRHLSTQQREQMEQYLIRHAEVCEKTEGHPNVAVNLTSAPVDGLWWVLDRWEDGETLEMRLGKGALSDYELNFIMRGIATGLAELHRCEVI